MVHYKVNGIWEEGDVYQFFNVDEIKQYETPFSKRVLNDFEQVLGKTWEDPSDIRYLENGNPVYHEYTVIGFEDNQAWDDYYWIVEDSHGNREYLLYNDSNFYSHLK